MRGVLGAGCALVGPLRVFCYLSGATPGLALRKKE